MDDYMKLTFKGVSQYPEQPKTEVEVSTDAVSLDEVLSAFEYFLAGMGFYIKGHLDIVNEEESNDETD